VVDDEVVSDTVWALSYITDGDKRALKLIMDNIRCDRLVQLVMNQKTSIRIPVMRIIGNLCTGSAHDVTTIINAHCLDALKPLLANTCQDTMAKREACWIVSNMAVGSAEHIARMLKENVFKLLHSLVELNMDSSVTLISAALGQT
jgi:importin subunit alpha-1